MHVIFHFIRFALPTRATTLRRTPLCFLSKRYRMFCFPFNILYLARSIHLFPRTPRFSRFSRFLSLPDTSSTQFADSVSRLTRFPQSSTLRIPTFSRCFLFDATLSPILPLLFTSLPLFTRLIFPFFPYPCCSASFSLFLNLPSLSSAILLFTVSCTPEQLSPFLRPIASLAIPYFHSPSLFDPLPDTIARLHRYIRTGSRHGYSSRFEFSTLYNRRTSYVGISNLSPTQTNANRA